MQKLFLVIWAIVLLQHNATAQITIRPNVTQSGLIQKSQLWNISIVYLSDDNPETMFEVTLTDRITGLPVLIGTSASFKLVKGVKLFTEQDLSPISYTTPNAQFNIQTTGLLPVGLYQVCYRVFNPQKKGDPMAEECIPVDVEALSPPLLNLPADSAVLQIQYPQFVWLPPTPVTIFPDLQYDFMLTEVLPKQSSQEAVQRNTPVYSISGLKQNTMAYPSSFPLLDTGKFYAWQIVAKNGGGYGAKSDIWVFKISQIVPSKTSPFVYYPKLTKQVYDAIYLAGSPIRFEFNNERNESAGEVQLWRTVGDLKKPISSKQISLQPGQNFISWATSLPSPTKEDQTFILKLILPSGEAWGCLLNIKATR